MGDRYSTILFVLADSWIRRLVSYPNFLFSLRLVQLECHLRSTLQQRLDHVSTAEPVRFSRDISSTGIVFTDGPFEPTSQDPTAIGGALIFPARDARGVPWWMCKSTICCKPADRFSSLNLRAGDATCANCSNCVETASSQCLGGILLPSTRANLRTKSLLLLEVRLCSMSIVTNSFRSRPRGEVGRASLLWCWHFRWRFDSPLVRG